VRNIVMWHERLGKWVDEIASDYGLTLANVYAALAYYFDHRVDIDKGLADGQGFAESLHHASKLKLNAGDNWALSRRIRSQSRCTRLARTRHHYQNGG